MTRRWLTTAWISSIASLFLFVAQAQQSPMSSSAALPHLLRFNGTAKDPSGHSLTGTVGITFSLYSDQADGSPLWLETQNVQLDNSGHYSVLLGSTKSEGLPVALFAAEQAHWVGVEISGQSEGPRVLLVSAPYALKAGDAETVGGLPPSAFMLAAPVAASTDGTSSGFDGSSKPEANVGGKGSTGYLAGWIDNNGDLGNSALFQTGSGSSAKVGLNLKNPVATLDIGGTELVRGLFESATIGTATVSKGFNSNPVDLEASSFNSSTQKAVMQHFEWQAEPTANNTSNPGATLNLLFGQNSTAPSETGLNIASTGQITFATGQTFPGTGNGTITGVAAGSDLTGGGSSGSVTLNLDTTKVPQLGSNNSFTGTEQFAGNTGIGTAPSGTSYTPLSVGSANSFGTWFSLANSSSGGHTWNIISAGGANAEGAGNLGFTDLTGKSTIWLEGTTNVTNGLTAITPNYIAALLQGPESGVGSALEMQTTGTGGDSWQILNTGAASAQGPNKLNFRNDSTGTDVMTLTADASGGHVGIGTLSPYSNVSFEVVGAPSTIATLVYGWGSNDSLDVIGGIAPNGSNGGTAIYGLGGEGTGTSEDGFGGVFVGGTHNGSGGTGFGEALLVRAGSGAAAQFYGDVYIEGNLSKAGGSFKIDHPLDPANKYLYHSFVESPDMMNIYNGIATLDATGNTAITMPDWFSALNRDFRYQLTAIGAPGPNLYIAEELTNNRFKIGGGKPGMKVSWQVTGIRQDEWANAHRIPLEEVKNENERGFYLHPELYGAPADKQIDWARHPGIMRHIEELGEQRPGTTKTAGHLNDKSTP